MMERYELIHGDCLEVMKTLPDKSVDLCLTDPPYGVSRPNNFTSMMRYYSYKGVDFGDWDKDFNQTEWIKIVVPKMKHDCSILIFNDWKNLGLISTELEYLGFSVKRPIVLKKRNPMPHNRERLFVNCFEFGVWATRGKWTFNRFGKYNQAFFETVNNGETTHPTEKHLPTIVELVKILSSESQTVLDPFMGSGTTGIACLLENRKFIGIEKESEYFEIAKSRIEAVETKEPLFAIA